jgi:hypothetical protein
LGLAGLIRSLEQPTKSMNTPPATKSRSITFIAEALATVLLLLASSSFAGGVAGDFGVFGQHKRPFYNFVHNPNSTDTDASGIGVLTGLNAGANALEPDLMRFADDAEYYAGVHINDGAGASGLFVYHDHVKVTTHNPITLEGWCDYVHNQASNGANIALIVFDTKSAAADYLKTFSTTSPLLTAVHTHLNILNADGVTYKDGVNIPVIYSVADLTSGDSDAFNPILTVGLRATEGIMVDGVNNDLNDGITVYNSLSAKIAGYANARYNIGFGDGGIGVSTGSLPFKSVLPAIQVAAWARASVGLSLAIPYAYPISYSEIQNVYITAGADGMIPDINLPTVGASDTADQISNVRDIVNSRTDVYMATAADNPFHNEAAYEGYALKVHTADTAGAGTDSDLTFTLNGCRGSSSITVNADGGRDLDAAFANQFEKNQNNYLFLPSKNLGKLNSITLSSSGNGLAGSKWTPDYVEISSWKYGIANPGLKATCNGSDVYSGHSQTMTVPAQAALPPVPTVANLPAITGQCSASLPAAPTATNVCGVTNVGTTTATGPFGQGDFYITWTYTDSDNLSTTQIQEVHVHDTVGPVINNYPISFTVTTGPGRTSCDQLASWTPPTATDGCTLVSFTSNHSPGETFPVGTTTVSYFATDEVQNTTTYNFFVTVVDDTPPVITCPSNIVLDATSAAGALANFTSTATDNCDPAPLISYSHNPGTIFAIGTNAVTSTAMDIHANASACSFIVTVRGPRAVLLDVISQLQKWQKTYTTPPLSEFINQALDALTRADDPGHWIDDTRVIAQGQYVFDQTSVGVKRLQFIAQRNPALASTVALMISREVRACRVLAETVLPGATGRNLQSASAELARGDAEAATQPDDAITRYKNAWTFATSK